jgi:hypothetical protein
VLTYGPATVRYDLGFRTASSNRTTRQVDQVSDTEAFANFPQLRAAGREETAQQPIPAEPLQPLLPVLRAKIQPLEDAGQLRRDRRLSLAKEPAGVGDRFTAKTRRAPRRMTNPHSTHRPSVPLRGLLDQKHFVLFIAFSLRALCVFAVNKEIPGDDRRYIAVVICYVCLE